MPARKFVSKEEVLTAAYMELEQFDRSRQANPSNDRARMLWFISFALFVTAIAVGILFLLRK